MKGQGSVLQNSAPFPPRIKINIGGRAGVRGFAVPLRYNLTMFRIGLGYDVHPLVSGRPLILGGVTIPYAKGLDGHSDADAVCHALTDAILGAAGLGSIGVHFPNTDSRYKNVSSLLLLKEAYAKVNAAGFVLGNADVVIVAEAPKLMPHAAAMLQNLAQCLGVDAGLLNIKATTTEGMGFTGRGEGIAVQAVALLAKTPKP